MSERTVATPAYTIVFITVASRAESIVVPVSSSSLTEDGGRLRGREHRLRGPGGGRREQPGGDRREGLRVRD